MAFFVVYYKVVTSIYEKVIYVPYTIIPESESVTINGLEQCKGRSHCYTTYEGNKIVFNDDVQLALSDVIQIKYQRD